MVLGWEKLPRPLRSRLSPATLSELSKYPIDWPELELLPLASTTAPTNDTDNYASVAIVLLATTSRGNVTINTTDTTYNPIVSPNWLLTTADQELAVQGFKRARQVANATGVIVGREYLPGPAIQTDAQILEYIRQTVGTIWHACGTCKLDLRISSPTPTLYIKFKTDDLPQAQWVESGIPTPWSTPTVRCSESADYALWMRRHSLCFHQGILKQLFVSEESTLVVKLMSSINLWLTYPPLTDMLAEKLADDILNGS